MYVLKYLEPDIPECEVTWALGRITMNKASGGDGIPVQLFQTLKVDVVWGFPGGPVAKTLCSQCWGHGFHRRSGN